MGASPVLLSWEAVWSFTPIAKDSRLGQFLLIPRTLRGWIFKVASVMGIASLTLYIIEFGPFSHYRPSPYMKVLA
jgi:hypothetical protein